MKIFFNSSLPRSGSTLLQNILAQNPLFYATPTSGVLELLHGAMANFGSSPEFKAQDFNLMTAAFKEFCLKGLEGFFSKITDKPFIIDKSRGWGIHYSFLNSFYSNPKIICMVRDLRGILASYEKLERNNFLTKNDIVNHSKLINTTTIKRINHRLNNPPIGLALNRLQEIILQKIDKHILFVKYEDLCEKPLITLKKIYEYLNVEHFNHDFLNINQITQEDDLVYGFDHLHDIKNYIEKSNTDYLEILGENACKEIYFAFKWYFDYFDYKE